MQPISTPCTLNFHPENYDRCVQDIWPRFRLPPTSRLPHRRFLHLPRASRGPAPISHSMFSIRIYFRSTRKRIPDVILAYALDSQDHYCSNGRQDGLPGCLLLSQTCRRRWIRLFSLPFQFSALGCTIHVSRLICSPPKSFVNLCLSARHAGKSTHLIPPTLTTFHNNTTQHEVPNENASETEHDSCLFVDRCRSLAALYTSSYEWVPCETGIHRTCCKSTLRLR